MQVHNSFKYKLWKLRWFEPLTVCRPASPAPSLCSIQGLKLSIVPGRFFFLQSLSYPVTLSFMGTLITQPAVQITVTPTLDTSAYAANDRLGSIMTLTNVILNPGGLVELEDVLIVDGATQSQAIDVIIFDSLPTIASADNAAIDFTDAQALKIVGSVSVAAASYKATASNSYVQAGNLGIMMRAALPDSPQGSPSNNLYAILVCRSGTPTYAASSLQVRFKFRQLS